MRWVARLPSERDEENREKERGSARRNRGSVEAAEAVPGWGGGGKEGRGEEEEPGGPMDLMMPMGAN